MARIFLSHSSMNDHFALWLAEQIGTFSHDVFLDEWEIRVGDSITQKINQGLRNSDYIVLVLTPHAVRSGWVEREWQSRYADEISTGSTIILPVMLETCDLPPLLRDKRYADFRKDHAVGFVHLMTAINTVIPQSPDAVIESIEPPSKAVLEVSELLAYVHDPALKLSQCLSQALALAVRHKHLELEEFCKSELYGWPGSEGAVTGDVPAYRLVEAFVSPLGEVNLQYMGFANNAPVLFTYMRRNPTEFFPRSFFVHHPVIELESRPLGDPLKYVVTMQTTWSAVGIKSDNPDNKAWVYCEGDMYSRVLSGIRVELTKRLLDILPNAVA